MPRVVQCQASSLPAERVSAWRAGWDCGERQVVTPSPKEMGLRRELTHVADTAFTAACQDKWTASKCTKKISKLFPPNTGAGMCATSQCRRQTYKCNRAARMCRLTCGSCAATTSPPSSSPGSSQEDWAVYKAGEVAPTCECCAVLLNKAPGEICHIVPVWELKDWVCPGCTPAVETASLCNRVVYNFKKAISSTNVYFDPSQWREWSSAPGVGYEYAHTLPGQSGQGILRGYYRDPACELKPSPGNFFGQASTNTAIYDLQLDPYPPPAPPTPPPVEAGWGNCCDRYGCHEAVEGSSYTGGGTVGCKGCKACSKLGGALGSALGCTAGVACQALCHKH